MTELSFTNDTLKRLAYLSNLDKALNKQISGVNEILRKLGGELKGLQEVFGKMEKIFNAAFEDSKCVDDLLFPKFLPDCSHF